METDKSWLLHITLQKEFRLPMERMKTRSDRSFSTYIARALQAQLKRDGYLKSEKK